MSLTLILVRQWESLVMQWFSRAIVRLQRKVKAYVDMIIFVASQWSFISSRSLYRGRKPGTVAVPCQILVGEISGRSRTIFKHTL